MRNNLNLSQLICELQGRLDQEAASTPTNVTDVVRRDEPMRHLEIQTVAPDVAFALDQVAYVIGALERLRYVVEHGRRSEWDDLLVILENRLNDAIERLQKI